MSNLGKIFVTGANGFVGQHLVSELTKKGYHCIKGDRELYGDIEKQQNWEQYFEDVYAVVHLAARVHVVNEISKDPLAEFRKMNVEATKSLAVAAKKAGVSRFIYLSSIKVNGGDSAAIPFTPEDTPKPEDPYGVSKMEAEKSLLSLHEAGVFEVVIIRPPLVYGPGVKANFQKLMSLSSMGFPLPFGLVNNKRSLVSVFNLVDLIVTCIHHPFASGQIFLVSDDCDLSLKEMIKQMAKVQLKNAILLPVPVSIMRFCASIIGKKSYADRLFGNLQVDISKTKKLLGWRPVMTFQETIVKIQEEQI